jgi:hypothetical protein
LQAFKFDSFFDIDKMSLPSTPQLAIETAALHARGINGEIHTGGLALK